MNATDIGRIGGFNPWTFNPKERSLILG